MFYSPEELATIVIKHLVDIMAGRCAITHEVISQFEHDPNMCEILTGLLYLHEDLTYRNRELAKRTEELNRTLKELWSEIDLARKIQTVLLPEDPRVGGYEVAAVMRPALQVGGDYYDIVPAQDGRVWVLIGDVSGHGVAAGLAMMMVQTAVRSLVLTLVSEHTPLTPSRMLSMLNSAMRNNLRKLGGDHYVTLTALCIDGQTVHHAGLHQDILVYRAASERVEAIETSGTWIGLTDDVTQVLRDQSFELTQGDTMLLFTDGLTEAQRDGRMLGTTGLGELFERLAKSGVSGRNVIKGILDHIRDYRVDDDVTVMMMRRREEPAVGRPPT